MSQCVIYLAPPRHVFLEKFQKSAPLPVAVGRPLDQVKLHGRRDGRDKPPEGRRPGHTAEDALHLPRWTSGRDTAEVHPPPDTQDRGDRRRHRLQPTRATVGTLFGVRHPGAVSHGERLPREGPQGIGQPAAHRHG